MRRCKECGKTSDDPNEVFAGLCRQCLEKRGQAVIVPQGRGSEPQRGNSEDRILNETPLEAWRRRHS